MRAWPAVLALSACSGGPVFLSSEGLEAIVLVELDRANVPQAVVHDFATADAKVERAITEGAPTYALGYVAKPALLPFGPIDLANRGAPLPAPDRRHQLVEGAWTELSELPAALSQLRLPSANRCIDYVASRRRLTLDSGEVTTFLVPTAPDRALLGTQLGRFFEITVDETTPLTTLATTTPHMAAFERDGEIFLVGPGTRFSRGHPDRGFVEGPAMSSRVSSAGALTGAPPGQPFELFAADGALNVQHFDGERWTLIRRSTGSVHEKARVGIAWSAPGLATIIGVGTSSAVELSKLGEERVITFPEISNLAIDALWSVGYVQDVGTIAGTRDNLVFQRASQQWFGRPKTELRPRADVILDLGDRRFLTGGEDGTYFEWGPGELDVCPPVLRSHAAESVSGIARLEDGFVAIANFVQGVYDVAIVLPDIGP